MKKKVSFKISIIEIEKKYIEFAKQRTNDPSEDVRAVAKAMIDCQSEAEKILDSLKNERPGDLAPYLDFWFADAIEAARRIVNSECEIERNMAKCLIEHEEAIARSRESILGEVKRVTQRPGAN